MVGLLKDFLSNKAESKGNQEDITSEPVAITDTSGRTLGLEDPNDPRLQDDPAIFPTVSVPEPSKSSLADPSKKLLDSKGKPFIDPRLYGGSMLDQSAGLGEPLNVIISALSTPDLLTRKGLQGYLRSLDFDMECLGLHSGNPQRAFLDPRGWVDENFLYREVYTPLERHPVDPPPIYLNHSYIFGTCIESLRGGNHLRAWQQQGTGAWFFATSKEENVTKHHMIVPNGYNIGRDELVQQSQKNKNGITSFMFRKYQTKVEYLTGLIQPGTTGINHDIATDGKVALLTIKLLSKDEKSLIKAKQQAIQSQQILISGTPAAGPIVEPARKQNVHSPTVDTKKQKRLSLKTPFGKKERQPVAQAV